MCQSSCVLEMKNISMEFPGVKALSGVDFSIRSGEIHAIVGANGAGKSTLMKILAGANASYAGDIFINSELVYPAKFSVSFRHGT
ncbi:MAG: ATP-binding cassette domain-containing protein [Rectinemataceae bacterium]|jgi:simple sugar transport system ATP-binding protein